MADKTPISPKTVVGMAALVLGGCFILFLLWKLRYFNDHVDAFKEVCTLLSEEVSVYGKSDLCNDSRKRIFINRAPFQELSLKSIGAEELPFDSRNRYLVFQNPYLFSALSYCYYVQQGRFPEKSLAPKDFSRTIAGLSIREADLPAYEIWRKSKAGLACAKQIHDDFNLELGNPRDELHKFNTVIILNPVSLIPKGKSVPEVIREINRQLNHERILALLNSCPDFLEWSELEWQKISEQDKKIWLEKYPSIAWENPLIAEREYSALRFESNPQTMLMRLGQCTK